MTKKVDSVIYPNFSIFGFRLHYSDLSLEFLNWFYILLFFYVSEYRPSALLRI